MTSDRVYRGRLTDDEAIAELDRCSGSQFDPDIVAALAEELGVGPRAGRLGLAGQAAARAVLAVALNDATTASPSASARRSADATVTSAVSGPTRTRTRLPSATSERTSPRRWLTAESTGSVRASDTSQG